MKYSAIVLAVLVVAAIAFVVAIARARAAQQGGSVKMHSRIGYYGWYAAIWTLLPALFLVFVWVVVEPIGLSRLIRAELPDNFHTLNAAQRSLIVGQIETISEGLSLLDPAGLDTLKKARLGFKPMSEAQQVLKDQGIVLGSAPEGYAVTAAVKLRDAREWSRMILAGLVGLVVLAGFAYSISSIRPRLRARNFVERVTLGGLIAASLVAILTTLGIVLSVLFETIHFFKLVSLSNFFLGTVWDPRFSAAGSGGAEGQFGLLPLLWGTLFISFVALAVAVPVGLFAAIYMSEYASQRVRNFAKPALEVLAGIPTIVYGFFALITFGPMLRDLGAMVGLNIAATSVLSAGIVMGVMIIPFVSSLSDDIISAVPQSLREGSYGLGATQSETIKRVIVPAALPGIVGAILLAASRAIGETMIVVLAAGIAANLTLNPFEPVTTITVKIVSQLTGDLEFDSPQTLVAFALGLTLFIITLALNVYALYIVRKYREQYE
ncbi:MAG: phosphate ABC transporter permease subunit PstC [Hyphomicrobiaceae bacterium]|nr:phosphate ABC transporter permease subunit PstC [Hyphomicrobiaceae bacterium]